MSEYKSGARECKPCMEHTESVSPQRNTHLGGDVQARRRRYFENKQDEIKRRVRDGHMKKSK